jgi:hypothetical protein
MKLEATCDAREGTKTVDVDSAYRVRVIGRKGQVIEVVEQMDGSFAITAATSIGCKLTVEPIAHNAIIVGVKR